MLHRQKDIQYSSRVASHISRQQQAHRICATSSTELAAKPARRRAQQRRGARARSYGCFTQMHVVRLLAPRLDNENHTKDVDFTPPGIQRRWEAGYLHTRRVLKRGAVAGQVRSARGRDPARARSPAPTSPTAEPAQH